MNFLKNVKGFAVFAIVGLIVFGEGLIRADDFFSLYPDGQCSDSLGVLPDNKDEAEESGGSDGNKEITLGDLKARITLLNQENYKLEDGTFIEDHFWETMEDAVDVLNRLGKKLPGGTLNVSFEAPEIENEMDFYWMLYHPDPFVKLDWNIKHHGQIEEVPGEDAYLLAEKTGDVTMRILHYQYDAVLFQMLNWCDGYAGQRSELYNAMNIEIVERRIRNRQIAIPVPEINNAVRLFRYLDTVKKLNEYLNSRQVLDYMGRIGYETELPLCYMVDYPPLDLIFAQAVAKDAWKQFAQALEDQGVISFESFVSKFFAECKKTAKLIKKDHEVPEGIEVLLNTQTYREIAESIAGKVFVDWYESHGSMFEKMEAGDRCQYLYINRDGNDLACVSAVRRANFYVKTTSGESREIKAFIGVPFKMIYDDREDLIRMNQKNMRLWGNLGVPRSKGQDDTPNSAVDVDTREEIPVFYGADEEE